MKKERLAHIINIIKETYKARVEKDSIEIDNFDLIDLDTLVTRIEEDYGDFPSDKELVRLILQLIQE